MVLLFPLLFVQQVVGADTREDSLLQVLAVQQQDSNRIVTLNELFKLKFSSDPASARRYATNALELARQSQVRPLISKMCNNLGVLESQSGNYEKSLVYHREAYRIRQEEGDSASLTGSLLNMGNVYFKQGDYERAVQNYQIASEISIAQQDTVGLLSAVGNIGTIYNEQGKYAKALQVYLNVLHFLEKLDKPGDLAGAQYNVGNVYQQMGMWEDAIIFLNRAMESYEQGNDLFGLIDVLQNLGEIRRELKEPVLAQLLYEKALSYADSVDDRYGQATCAMGLATFDVERGDYAAAMEKLDRALEGYRSMGRRKGEADALNHIGWVLIEQEKFVAALVPLRASLAISRELDAINLSRNNLRLLAQAEAGIGRYDQAYENFRDFFTLHDSVYSEVNASRIAELNTRYKTRERQSEIDRLNLARTKDQLRITRSRWRNYFLLAGLIIAFLVALVFYTRYRQKQKRNREIARMNKEVQFQRDRLGEQNRQIREINTNLERMIESRTAAVLAAKHELDTFLYESAHALRRPLTRIEGLVHLINMEDDPAEQENMREKLAFTVRGMDSLLHKLIMVNENERREVEIREIDFSSLLDEVVAELDTGELQVELQIDDGLTLFSDDYLIRTLMQNLMENSCHYQTELAGRQPKAVVRLSGTDTEVILEVEDNGKGIPNEQLGQVFDMFFRGYVRSGCNGLGLYVARKIAGRLHGSIAVESEEGEWTRVTVQFPRHQL